MLELSLVVWGLAAATLGWYWAGVSEGRTSWVPLAGASVVLAGITVFAAGDTPISVWGFAAVVCRGRGPRRGRNRLGRRLRPDARVLLTGRGRRVRALVRQLGEGLRPRRSLRHPRSRPADRRDRRRDGVRRSRARSAVGGVPASARLGARSRRVRRRLHRVRSVPRHEFLSEADGIPSVEQT